MITTKNLLSKTHPQKLLVSIFLIVIVLLSVGVFFYDSKAEEYRLNKFGDMMAELLRVEIKRQKDSSVTLALAIASNDSISKSVLQQDRQKAGYELDGVMSSFDTYDWPSKFWIQIHTSDLKVFLRSWDKSEYGMPLEGFRKGLVIVKSTNKPYASIELGKKLNIKAIVPVRSGSQYIGSLEVIKNFDDTVNFFKSKGVSLLVLMEKKHLKIAEWMLDYPMMDEFVVCHREFDEEMFEELKHSGLYSKVGFKNAIVDNYFLVFEPIRDVMGERLGFFVIGMSKQKAMEMSKTPDKLSFFSSYSKDELANSYKQRAQNNIEPNGYGGILSLESKAEKIKSMSRHELEELAIYGDRKEKKVGEIR